MAACRSCDAPAVREFLDLGDVPLADALVTPGQESAEERFPLAVGFCDRCALVQLTTNVAPARLFGPAYPYFSGYSDTFRAHTREAVRSYRDRFRLGPGDFVVEIGSNDGTLLSHFDGTGVEVLGVDPVPLQAAAARARGLPVLERFFGREVGAEIVAGHGRASLVVANNVLAHVPDLDSVFGGISALLRPGGHLVFENQYLGDIMERCEYDTIYHEHAFYYSCTSVADVLRRRGLQLVDVEYFPRIHGGSLRWYATAEPGSRSETLDRWLEAERAGPVTFDYLANFRDRVASARGRLRDLLFSLHAGGATIAAYGAAAKGASLLNYLGIGRDLVRYVVDRNPRKQGLLLPGSHVPIDEPGRLARDRPGYVLLLAWNFRDEILRQQADYLAGGGRFIVPGPEPEMVGGPA